MTKKIFSKLIIIAFIGFIGAIAMPTEAEAHLYEGDFTMNGTTYRNGGINCYYICCGWYFVNDYYGWVNGKFVSSGGGFFAKITFHNNNDVIFSKIMQDDAIVELQDFEFSLSPGENLQVMASVNAKCDVYTLETGQLLLKDFDIASSNSYQSVPVMPSNTPYIIQFKVDGNVVSQQYFIFINSNYLSIGGKSNE